MERQRLIYLIGQYSNDAATAEELGELQQFLDNAENMELFTELVADSLMKHKNPSADANAYATLSQQVLQIDKGNNETKTIIKPIHRVHFMRRWGWAAAIIILIGAGTYLWTTNQKNANNVIIAKTTTIAPGSDGAILTLANGSQVLLDSIKNDVVALQGGVTARVINGTLVYQGEGNEAVYNIMSTPKGRQFQLVLPDGTRVWLNSASSIRYPTVFSGKERSVEISGEAYFEVAKNTAMPFRVNANRQADIEVLGTHFNINAYENERSLNTTLLEGAIAVYSVAGASVNRAKTIIKPGQQAIIDRQAPAIIAVMDHANIEQIMAWKNGLFNFDGARLEDVLKQLERWYDIEVLYNKPLPDVELAGEMTRGVTLNDLLIVLEKLNIHTKLEGRKLIIL